MRDKMKEVVRIVALRIYRVCQHVWDTIRYVLFTNMYFWSVKLLLSHFLLTAKKQCLFLCNCFHIYQINYYIRQIAKK